jgi:hypothetical protein
MRISCAFGSGTGIVTSEKSLILLYRIAFISVGMTNFTALLLVIPLVTGILAYFVSILVVEMLL